MAPLSDVSKRPSKEMLDEMVEVRTGSGQANRNFHLHKGMLCFYSQYFHDALRGGGANLQYRAIALPEESAAIFEHFAYWLYTRCLPKLEDEVDCMMLLELWMLGDRLGIPILMNETINRLRDLVVQDWNVKWPLYAYIYEGTSPESALRRFIVFDLSRCGTAHILEREKAKVPMSMVADILVETFKLREEGEMDRWGTEDLALVDMCQFHEHEAGEICSDA